MNLFRVRAIEFPKTDAFGIFEAIKKSPFLNGNSITRPIPEKASAEIRANAQQKRYQTLTLDTLCFVKKLYNNSYFEAGRRPRKRSLLKRK